MSNLSLSQIELDYLSSLLKSKGVIKVFETRVGSTGRTRDLMCIAYVCGEVLNISSLVAEIAGKKLNKKGDAVFLKGCGMDMSFALEMSFNNALKSVIAGEPSLSQYTDLDHYFTFKSL